MSAASRSSPRRAASICIRCSAARREAAIDWCLSHAKTDGTISVWECRAHHRPWGLHAGRTGDEWRMAHEAVPT